jgi:hypothetical protein
LVHPRGEFPVLLFIKGPEKAQGLDSNERGFAVIISRIELLHKVVNEGLVSTRISFVEHILLSVRNKEGSATCVTYFQEGHPYRQCIGFDSATKRSL